MEEDLFIYQWNIEDKEDKMEVKGFGIDERGETRSIRIQGFMTWIVIEIKKENGETDRSWIEEKKRLKEQIMELCQRIEISNPLQIIWRKKLYGYDEKQYPFIRIRAETIEKRNRLYYSINKKRWTGMQGRRRVFIVHENEASPLLQMLCEHDLPSVGWIQYNKSLTDTIHITNIKKQNKRNEIPNIRIMSFDIECYSTDTKRIPDATNKEDIIFQISCVLSRNHEKRLLTLGKVDRLSGIIIKEFKTEKELILGFRNEILEYDPHIIIGYNIFGFDLPYIMERARYHNCYETLLKMGRNKEDIGRMQKITWSSTAYSYQEIYYIHLLGRIFVDMLQIIKRDYKFSNYRLKTVSKFFIGDTKDPFTPSDIFASYREYKEKGETKKLTLCGKYCIQDSNLVLLLFEKLQTWIGLVEMARLCNVSLHTLYTQGQQVKVFSQIFKICIQENILVENYRSIENNKITTEGSLSGAFVFTPEAGLYEWVVPFDFSSLYPTTIIAYNIDYSTLVMDESISDEKCHVIEWIEEDIKYKYRFIKEPVGILPKLLKSLLEGRKEIKREMKKHKNGEVMYVVLDKRQSAYKVSANSAYGAMGVSKGYLPFMPGAMSTTAMGRMNIQKAANIVNNKYKGKIIYGDSVTASTILMIRNKDNAISLISIEELYKKFFPIAYPELDKIGNEKYRVEIIDEIYILSKSGWTRINKIISHKTEKKIFRIYSASGYIEVTEDHSLILENGELISPKDIMIGRDVLKTVDKQEFEYIDLMKGKILMKSNNIYYRNDEMLVMKMEDHVSCMSMYLFLRNEFPDMVIRFENDKMIFDIENKKKTKKGTIYKIEYMNNTPKTVYDIETEDGTFHAGIGELIVKNTDSIYCHFTGLNNSKDLWKTAKDIENELGNKIFPPPIKLLFEEKLYQRFLILTKKRYMALTCNENGKYDEELTSRGVLLARRDNCTWIRSIYEKVVRKIMQKMTFSVILDYINDEIMRLFIFQIENRPECLIISKLLGKDYKIRSLPDDSKKRQQRLNELDIDENSSNWKTEYEEKSKPAHVQLATRMKNRGFPISCGSRIEYIILEDFSKKSKLSDKIEDPEYFWKHRDILRIDSLYYLQSLIKPIDQILHIVFKCNEKNGPVYTLYKYHLQHKIITTDISCYPKFKFVI